MKVLSKRPPKDTTARVVACIVREDPCVFKIETPQAVRNFWTRVIAAQPDFEPDKESLCAIMLNTKLRPYAWNRISLGSINGTAAEPREVFRPVIAAGAYAFVLIHNHPSGDPTPSRLDEELTKIIIECAKILRIEFMDHIIVPSGEMSEDPAAHFSFRGAGIIT